MVAGTFGMIYLISCLFCFTFFFFLAFLSQTAGSILFQTKAENVASQATFLAKESGIVKVIDGAKKERGKRWTEK